MLEFHSIVTVGDDALGSFGGRGLGLLFASLALCLGGGHLGVPRVAGSLDVRAAGLFAAVCGVALVAIPADRFAGLDAAYAVVGCGHRLHVSFFSLVCRPLGSAFISYKNNSRYLSSSFLRDRVNFKNSTEKLRNAKRTRDTGLAFLRNECYSIHIWRSDVRTRLDFGHSYEGNRRSCK